MGDQLYGRRCKVTIATPVSTPGDFKTATSNVLEVNGGDDPNKPGLRVRFKVKKSREKEPNTAEIIITNLAKTTRDGLGTKGSKVLLEAGYAGTGINRIFLGDARTIDHVREGADWSTVLRCGDGERGYRFARASESFAAGTQAADVLRYLGAQLGLDKGNVDQEAAAINVRFDQGYVVWGAAQAELDRLLGSIGYGYSIQDGVLQVLQTDASLTGVAIPEITPDTGLVGSPQMGTPEKAGAPALLKFKSLLTPTRPGGRVYLRSERYKGQLVVKKCEYSGDTHGGDWYTTIEGVLLGQ